jgi:hypothetical protein
MSVFESHACKCLRPVRTLQVRVGLEASAGCPKSKKQKGNLCVCVCLGHESSAHPPSTYFTCMAVGGKRVISVCVHTQRDKTCLSFHPMLPLLSLVGEKNLLFVSQNITLERHFLRVRPRVGKEWRRRRVLRLVFLFLSRSSSSLSLSFTVFNSANAPSVLFRSQTISRSALSLLIFCHLKGGIQLH